MKHILNKAAASFPEKVSGRPLVYKQTPQYRFSLSLHTVHYSGGFPTEQHKSCWQRLPVLFCHHLPAGGGATHTVGSLFVKNQQVQILRLSTVTAMTAKIQQRKRDHMSATSLMKDSGFHFPHIRETHDSHLGYTVTTRCKSENLKKCSRSHPLCIKKCKISKNCIFYMTWRKCYWGTWF